MLEFLKKVINMKRKKDLDLVTQDRHMTPACVIGCQPYADETTKYGVVASTVVYVSALISSRISNMTYDAWAKVETTFAIVNYV